MENAFPTRFRDLLTVPTFQCFVARFSVIEIIEYVHISTFGMITSPQDFIGPRKIRFGLKLFFR